MADSTNQDLVPARLHCGIVVRVREDTCEIVRDRQLCSVRYATPFPSPRTERVSPGHLVAIATAPDGTEAVVWRGDGPRPPRAGGRPVRPGGGPPRRGPAPPPPPPPAPPP